MADALRQGPAHHAPVYGLVLAAQHPGYREGRGTTKTTTTPKQPQPKQPQPTTKNTTDITSPGYPTRRGAQRVASKEAT